jgi:predicted amidohydrolase
MTEGRVESPVKIACVQMEPAVGESEANIQRSAELIETAAGQGANLIVLPELANSGYVFKTREEAFALSEELPGGPACETWSALAARHGLHIVAGICEREGEVLYNSSVVIGPKGHVGTFRKVHLWNEENLFFEPGNLGYPVFKTPIGRIGTFICYDCWFPESFRLCALQGADIICVPTN